MVLDSPVLGDFRWPPFSSFFGGFPIFLVDFLCPVFLVFGDFTGDPSFLVDFPFQLFFGGFPVSCFFWFWWVSYFPFFFEFSIF